jgi:hypothetical protein
MLPGEMMSPRASRDRRPSRRRHAPGKLLPGKTDVRPPDRDAGLELADEEPFHQRMWRVRHVGRIGMGLLVIAGLAGLLGVGPLSRAEVRGPDGLRIEHARFARADAPQALKVHMPTAAPGGHRLAVSRTILDRVRLESVVPAPLRTEVLADGVAFVFAAGPSAASAVATFHFTPRSMGLVEGGIGVPGLAPLTIRMLVYP